MTCTNDRYGPVCQLADPHDGTNVPHRNGLLVWHDPPLILVAGEPVRPLTDRERGLLGLNVERLAGATANETSSRRRGTPSTPPSLAAPVTTQIGVNDPWPDGFF